MAHTGRATEVAMVLRRSTPATHNYAGQAIPRDDDAVYFTEASHIAVGDYLLLGSRMRPACYQVRQVAYHTGGGAYWRVCVTPRPGAPAPSTGSTTRAQGQGGERASRCAARPVPR